MKSMEQTGLETQFSYESYALDKLRFARDYGYIVGVLLLFVCFNLNSLQQTKEAPVTLVLKYSIRI